MYNSVNIYYVFYIIAMRCTHPKEYKYFARSSVKSDFGLSFSKVSLPNRKDGLDSVFFVCLICKGFILFLFRIFHKRALKFT